MKKYTTLISILAVIIAAHVLILVSCLYSEKKEIQKELKSVTSEQSAVQINPQPVKTEPVQQEASAQQPAGVPDAPMVLKPERYGEPFIYQHAVNGNIRVLPLSKTATSGILVDLTTRNVLWAKNPQKSYPIASMTKLMTCLLAYEDVLAGRNGVTLKTPIQVSAAASKIGGSQVYLDPRETFTLEELMKATTIKSANDAAYQIAEFLGGGSVSSFVRRMNTRAAQLQMPNTHFYNPNGLPGNTAATDNSASPEGMARLAEETLRYPYLVKLSSTWMDTFRKPGEKGYMQIKNHNYLLPSSRSAEAAAGVDGLKTGFIKRSGYCVTVTCLRDGHRLVAVVTGFPMRRERDRFVKDLLDWGYERVDDPAAALRKDPSEPVREKTAKKPVRKKNTKPVKQKTKTKKRS